MGVTRSVGGRRSRWAHRRAGQALQARVREGFRAGDLTVPLPTLSGEASQRSMPRILSAGGGETILSMMVSTAPTSWKWTFSTGMEWMVASAWPSS